MDEKDIRIDELKQLLEDIRFIHPEYIYDKIQDRINDLKYGI